MDGGGGLTNRQLTKLTMVRDKEARYSFHRVYKIKLVLFVGPLLVFTFFYFVVLEMFNNLWTAPMKTLHDFL